MRTLVALLGLACASSCAAEEAAAAESLIAAGAEQSVKGRPAERLAMDLALLRLRGSVSPGERIRIDVQRLAESRPEAGIGQAEALDAWLDYARIGESAAAEHVGALATDCVDALAHASTAEGLMLGSALLRAGTVRAESQWVEAGLRAIANANQSTDEERCPWYLVEGALIERYECTGAPAALQRAVDLQTLHDRDCDDEWHEITIDSTTDHAAIARNLLRLALLTGDPVFRDEAGKARAGLRSADGHPPAIARALLALAEAQTAWIHLTIVGGADEFETRALLAAAARSPRPVLATTLSGDEAWKPLRARFPAMALMERVDGKPTAYVCLPDRCFPPVTDSAALSATIEQAAQVGGAH